MSNSRKRFKSESSLRRTAIQGAIWTLGGYGSSQALRLVSHLALAWLLAPELFGLMALVKVFMQGMEMFTDLGIKPSIIQNPRGHDPKFLNTAWTIQIIRGFGLWIVTCLLAWPCAAMFARNDETAWALVYLLPVAGLGTVLSGFNSTALATLNKDLRLDRLTVLEIASQVVSLAVMIVWALVHPTVWAMIAGGLASNVFMMVASHLVMPGYRVRPAWDRECATELVKFGKWIFLSTAFTFIATNFDRIVLGNLLSLAELGIYSIAFVFAKVPFYISARLGNTVLFPVYARYHDNPNRMIEVAIEARDVVLWVGAGVCASLMILSPLFFETLWDQRYHEAGFISQWMAVYVWAMIVLLTMEGLPLALGNSRALFVANVIRCTGLAFSTAGYFAGGLPGFIIGLSLGVFLTHLYLLKQVPTQRLTILVQGLQFSLYIAVYVVPALYLVRWVSDGGHGPAWISTVVVLGCVPPCYSALVVWSRLRKPPQPRATIAGAALTPRVGEM